MSDRGERYPDPDATVAFGGGRVPPPPGATQPMYIGEGPPTDRRRQILALVLAFVVGIAVGLGVAQFTGNDDDRIPSEDLVLFENAASTFPVNGAQFTSSTFDIQQQRCDAEQLKQLLRADRHRFEAWLELQGISESEFDSFVDRLDTKILDQATPVTNHGCFPDGDGPCPFAIQSVLAAGTPVWIDPSQGGRIVAKCACSNPIKEPKCPPNCEDIPTPSPSPTPTETPTFTPTSPPRTATPPPRTAPPTPVQTIPPTQTPILTAPPQTIPPTIQPPQ